MAVPVDFKLEGVLGILYFVRKALQVYLGVLQDVLVTNPFSVFFQVTVTQRRGRWSRERATGDRRTRSRRTNRRRKKA